jgi:hypothetical protein
MTNQGRLKALSPQYGHCPSSSIAYQDPDGIVMQHYEIHRRKDGTVDCANFRARPVSLLTPNMQRFCRQAASPKILLLVVATVSVLVLAAAQSFPHAASRPCAATRIGMPTGS